MLESVLQPNIVVFIRAGGRVLVVAEGEWR